MFYGTYYNSIDAKNRVIVPAKFREVLGEGCILTIGMENCLCIYSVEDFEILAEKLEGIPESARIARMYARTVFANAADCTFDKQGRIIVPQHLKGRANIDKELVTIGVKNRVEIWSKENWSEIEDTAMFDTDEVAAALQQVGF